MLKRKVMDRLISWKKYSSDKALIVNGARQVGKTYIIREFGKTNYASFVELNFIEHPEYVEIFDGALDSASILTAIKLSIPAVEVIAGDTLLFLDEIQDCPNAITALKFLATDKRINVVASGSALGMSYNRVTSYPVGSIEYIDMNAMSFEEFLWANEIDEEIIETVKGYFEKKEAVPIAIHKRMMELLLQYMVIGGMPEIVDKYIETKDFELVDHIQKRIYRDYISDIARYAKPEIKIKTENCFKSIQRQLSKDNHKFQYSVVEKNGTARKFESSLDWLVSANMILPVTNVSFVEYPLESHAIEDNIRIYMSDIGLLIGTYNFTLKKSILRDVMEEITDDLVLKTAKGGLYEALIADMLYKNGHQKLYFYRNEAGTAEMEFLIENETGVVPVEVKAGRKGAKTLTNLLKKDDISMGYKLAAQNVGVDGKKITMPLYMAMFL